MRSGRLENHTVREEKRVGAVAEGIGLLYDGSVKLSDGAGEFAEAGEELARLVDGIRAVKTADERYDNFAGIRKGQNGSVKFIIETEETE